MNTFHIDPTSPLAAEAAVLVAKMEPGAWAAIRGQSVYSYTDDEGKEVFEDCLYTVCDAPADCSELGGRREYIWSYVPADIWLRMYHAIQQGK